MFPHATIKPLTEEDLPADCIWKDEVLKVSETVYDRIKTKFVKVREVIQELRQDIFKSVEEITGAQSWRHAPDNTVDLSHLPQFITSEILERIDHLEWREQAILERTLKAWAQQKPYKGPEIPGKVGQGQKKKEKQGPKDGRSPQSKKVREKKKQRGEL